MSFVPRIDQIIIAGELVIITVLLVIVIRLVIDDITWGLALKAFRKNGDAK